MLNKTKNLLFSTKFIIIQGLIVIPFISFLFITISSESPLYTSISRIAWIHGYWFTTLLWALIIMFSIAWITYRMTVTGPLTDRSKKIFIICQLINIILVFIGCIIFPAKQDSDNVLIINYLHDYLTIIGWGLYGIGLIAYSAMVRKKDKFLGFLGLGIMSFIVFSSIFFISRVVDPNSYVGASAVSEVYIINSLFIFLIVMYVAQEYAERLKTTENALNKNIASNHCD